MEGEMQCPHCRRGLRIEGDQLVCSCGYKRDTPYKIVPDQAELFRKNADLITKYKMLYDKLAQIKDVIEGEGTSSRRVADITEIVEDK